MSGWLTSTIVKNRGCRRLDELVWEKCKGCYHADLVCKFDVIDVFLAQAKIYELSSILIRI